MDVWVSLPLAPPAELVELAQHLDGTGVTGVAVSDHLFVPDDVASPYPYTGGRPAELPPDTYFSDPVTVIAALGAVTARLRFMTYTLLAPLWHPIVAARQVATAVALLGDRIDVAVGVGWMREEYDALGIPFESRGRRLDEAIPLLRRLWSEDTVEHTGDAYGFRPLSLRPRPPSPIPVLVGGHSRPAIRRAAQLGDGWVGVNPDLPELEAIIALLAQERTAAATDDRPFVVRTGLKGPLGEEQLRELAKLGVDGLVVLSWQLRAKGSVSRRRWEPAVIAERAADVVERLDALSVSPRSNEHMDTEEGR